MIILTDLNELVYLLIPGGWMTGLAFGSLQGMRSSDSEWGRAISNLETI